jgi:Ca2+-binding EF-hand superfamily protein
MKAGLGSDGKVLRSRRILTDTQLLRSPESLPSLSANETTSSSSGCAVQRRSSARGSLAVGAASLHARRSLQARRTIESIEQPASGEVPSKRLSLEGLFEKADDPRAIARMEFEEVKRLAREYQMDFGEVRQVADIFYAADENDSGGLGKKELEIALARIFDVHVVPAEELEKAWDYLIGMGEKKTNCDSFQSVEQEHSIQSVLFDEMEMVNIDAFFHWYVEIVGKRVVSRAVRRKPSLVSQLSPLPEMPTSSRTRSDSSFSLPSTTAGCGPFSAESWPPLLSTAKATAEPDSPTSSPTSPVSPLTPPTPVMPEKQLAALSGRFNRFAQGSGVRGALYYPQFLLMLCELYGIPSPKLVQKKWANSLWRAIDVDNDGSINFESFRGWYTKIFDPLSGERLTAGTFNSSTFFQGKD